MIKASARVRTNDDAQITHLKTATHMVEATDFEQSCLWRDWHYTPRLLGSPRRCAWEQISLGLHKKIGTLANFPVHVSVSFARVEGALVAFYEATSRVVDHDMVKTWLIDSFPSALSWSNAQNFHNTVLDIERRKTGVP